MDERAVEEMVALIGEPGEIERSLAQSERDERFISRNRARLIRKHPDQWVAVSQGKLVAVARNQQELLRIVDERNVPRGQIVVAFLATRSMPMILAQGCHTLSFFILCLPPICQRGRMKARERSGLFPQHFS